MLMGYLPNGQYRYEGIRVGTGGLGDMHGLGGLETVAWATLPSAIKWKIPDFEWNRLSNAGHIERLEMITEVLHAMSLWDKTAALAELAKTGISLTAGAAAAAPGAAGAGGGGQVAPVASKGAPTGMVLRALTELFGGGATGRESALALPTKAPGLIPILKDPDNAFICGAWAECWKIQNPSAWGLPSVPDAGAVVNTLLTASPYNDGKKVTDSGGVPGWDNTADGPYAGLWARYVTMQTTVWEYIRLYDRGQYVFGYLLASDRKTKTGLVILKKDDQVKNPGHLAGFWWAGANPFAIDWTFPTYKSDGVEVLISSNSPIAGVMRDWRTGGANSGCDITGIAPGESAIVRATNEYGTTTPADALPPGRTVIPLGTTAVRNMRASTVKFDEATATATRFADKTMVAVKRTETLTGSAQDIRVITAPDTGRDPGLTLVWLTHANIDPRNAARITPNATSGRLVFELPTTVDRFVVRDYTGRNVAIKLDGGGLSTQTRAQTMNVYTKRYLTPISARMGSAVNIDVTVGQAACIEIESTDGMVSGKLARSFKLYEYATASGEKKPCATQKSMVSLVGIVTSGWLTEVRGANNEVLATLDGSTGVLSGPIAGAQTPAKAEALLRLKAQSDAAAAERVVREMAEAKAKADADAKAKAEAAGGMPWGLIIGLGVGVVALGAGAYFLMLRKGGAVSHKREPERRPERLLTAPSVAGVNWRW